MKYDIDCFKEYDRASKEKMFHEKGNITKDRVILITSWYMQCGLDNEKAASISCVSEDALKMAEAELLRNQIVYLSIFNYLKLPCNTDDTKKLKEDYIINMLKERI